MVKMSEGREVNPPVFDDSYSADDKIPTPQHPPFNRSAHDVINSLPSYTDSSVVELKPGEFKHFRSVYSTVVIICDAAGLIHCWQVSHKLV